MGHFLKSQNVIVDVARNASLVFVGKILWFRVLIFRYFINKPLCSLKVYPNKVRLIDYGINLLRQLFNKIIWKTYFYILFKRLFKKIYLKITFSFHKCKEKNSDKYFDFKQLL